MYDSSRDYCACYVQVVLRLRAYEARYRESIDEFISAPYSRAHGMAVCFKSVQPWGQLVEMQVDRQKFIQTELQLLCACYTRKSSF